MNTPLPARLYKYASLQADRLRWARDIIVDRRVYFANPTTFNDPFDCRFLFSMTGTDAQWDKFLRRPEVAAENGGEACIRDKIDAVRSLGSP